LPDEGPDWIEEIIELALAGQFTEAVIVPVLPAYHNILGPRVWFCPDPLTAQMKKPDLVFTSEELIVIIPLLIENRELASTLVSAKRIFGGNIMGSSLDLRTAEPHNGQARADDWMDPEEDGSLDPADPRPANHNCSTHQDAGGTPTPRKGLPGPGRHLVIIRSVKTYLHNFPDYTGPRARIEMEIMEDSDVGKILVDNVSLLHPKESRGMLLRRLRIAKRLGLITRGPMGEIIQLGGWKLLEGVACWVDVAYKTLCGRKIPMVDNYELQ
jgi:hypothetical protein